MTDRQKVIWIKRNILRGLYKDLTIDQKEKLINICLKEITKGMADYDLEDWTATRGIMEGYDNIQDALEVDYWYMPDYHPKRHTICCFKWTGEDWIRTTKFYTYGYY